MTTIDRYIRRATVGLPPRERVDLAAELRVHLNERARALAAEGFARDEAEHLVVERMGPVDPINRQFLGHAFTVRAGWAAAVILALGVLAWFAANYLFAPALIARPHDLTLTDVLPLIGDLAAVDLALPTATHSATLAVTQGGAALFTSATRVVAGVPHPTRPSQRVRRTLVMGFPGRGGAASDCREASRPFVLRSEDSSSATCLTLPAGSLGGTWHQLTEGGLPVRFGAWQPLLAFEPTFPPATMPESLLLDPDASFPPTRQALPDDWIVLSVYPASAPLDALGELPPPPTGRDLFASQPLPDALR